MSPGVKELNFGASCSDKPSQELCSPAAPLPGEEGMGQAVQPGRSRSNAALPAELCEPQRHQIPPCSTWIREGGAKLGCHCSKPCPESLQTHLSFGRGILRFHFAQLFPLIFCFPEASKLCFKGLMESLIIKKIKNKITELLKLFFPPV